MTHNLKFLCNFCKNIYKTFYITRRVYGFLLRYNNKKSILFYSVVSVIGIIQTYNLSGAYWQLKEKNNFHCQNITLSSITTV